MAKEICVLVSNEDWGRLSAHLGNRNIRKRHAQCAGIVRLSAGHLPVLKIARQTEVTPELSPPIAATLRRIREIDRACGRPVGEAALAALLEDREQLTALLVQH